MALVLRVPFAPAIGALVFLGVCVPIVGALASGMIAVLIALVAQGPITALLMLAGVIAVQQIESHVLQPFLLANDNGEVEDQTEARVLYTDDALWIAFTCHESAMDRLVLNATERDGVVWEDDSTEVFINTNGLGRPYVQLIANASGVQFDGRQPETGAFEFDWTGGWQVSTSKEPGLWTAVYRIPFAVLGVTGGVKGRMWMMNLIRNDHASALSDELGPHWMNVSAWGSKPRGFNHDTRRFRAFVFD